MIKARRAATCRLQLAPEIDGPCSARTPVGAGGGGPMAGSGGGACVQWGRAQSRERHRNEQRERRKRAGLISLSPPPAPPPPSAPLPPPAPVPRATEAPPPLLPLLVAEDHQPVEDVGVGGWWSCWWPPPAQYTPSRPTGGRTRPTRARSVAGWLAVGGGQERAGQLWRCAH